ncbi:helix-turn-helix domain-containing protein [Novosphingobium sp. ZN18A2]|uniref:helix-turn-helix domain-containing protein n=1 Tax=Novosphingobium sp. ZN18A2 TaxID=3079861 RepID=UPI0030D27283
MGEVVRYATEHVAPSDRLRYWNDLVDRIYTGTFVNANEPDFRGEMLSWSVGELDMIRPMSGPSLVGRLPRDADEERIILHLQCRGTTLHTQSGRECMLEPGDFVLGSPHDRYDLRLSAHELLVVEFPRAPLMERCPGLDEILAQRINGASPGGRVFHDFLLSLWRQGDQSAADPEWETGVSRVFYDLAALALRGAEREAPRLAESRFRERALAMVEARLCDPSLRTATLAAELGTSVRTVQNLFAGMGTTPSAWILERRLRRAADQLIADPQASITEIAFDHGFNDSAYFTRCFRHHFGTAPREWRGGH